VCGFADAVESPLKLLYTATHDFAASGGVELAVDASGEAALETSADLAVGLAFCPASICVGSGLGVVEHTDHGDDSCRWTSRRKPGRILEHFL
jgi:hypothetical protein